MVLGGKKGEFGQIWGGEEQKWGFGAHKWRFAALKWGVLPQKRELKMRGGGYGISAP